MATINIYLNFNGNCEKVFTFYKSVFGGEFDYVGRFRDMPPQEGMKPLPEADLDKIMHISLPISKETILMGSDSAGEWANDVLQGNNFSIYVKADNTSEAERLFNGLSAGGKVTMPLSKTFWSSAFGMLTDQFGINWMLSADEQP